MNLPHYPEHGTLAEYRAVYIERERLQRPMLPGESDAPAYDETEVRRWLKRRIKKYPAAGVTSLHNRLSANGVAIARRDVERIIAEIQEAA